MPVPDRWLQYSKFGQKIPGTQFLALKCPLKQGICNNLPDELRFTPQMLLEELPQVRMLIDLTNTSKYYHPQELRGLQHVKVMCAGKQVPNAAVQSSFFEAVDSFLQSDDSQDRLIGVHCTHGVNRTGFLICKYMVSKLGFAPEEAARAFNDSRGHKMEREAYIRALKVPDELMETVLGDKPVDKRLEKQYIVADRAPRDDYRQYRDSQQDYRGESYEFRSRTREYRGNSRDCRGNSREFRGNPREFRGNSREFRGNPREFRGSSRGYRGNARGSRGDTYEYRDRREFPERRMERGRRDGGRGHFSGSRDVRSDRRDDYNRNDRWQNTQSYNWRRDDEDQSRKRNHGDDGAGTSSRWSSRDDRR